MKTLIWKEWREIRTIPLGMTALFIAVNLFCIMVEIHARRVGHPESFTFAADAMLSIAAVACVISGMLCGSALFSGEIGAGTLAFLTMLSMQRNTIWLSKVIAGFGGLAATMGGVLLSGALILFARCAASPPQSKALLEPLRHPAPILANLGIVLLIAVGCFGIALTISLLVDRTLASAVLSIVACVALPVLGAAVVNLLGAYFPTDPEFVTRLIYVVWALMLPTFLAASFYIFVHGETLRTRKRFVLLGRSLVAWAFLNGVVIVGMYLSRPSGVIL